MLLALPGCASAPERPAISDDAWLDCTPMFIQIGQTDRDVESSRLRAELSRRPADKSFEVTIEKQQALAVFELQTSFRFYLADELVNKERIKMREEIFSCRMIARHGCDLSPVLRRGGSYRLSKSKRTESHEEALLRRANRWHPSRCQFLR
jgi:hypothetical protein